MAKPKRPASRPPGPDRRRGGAGKKGPSKTGPTGVSAKSGPRSGGKRKAPTLQLPPNALVFEVGPETGTDLAHYLAEIVPGKQSVRAIRRALDQGRCLVNGQAERFGSRRVKRKDLVVWIPPQDDERVSHRYDPRRLLFAEQGVIAYDKPPGLPVTPTDAGKGQHLLGLLNGPLGVVDAAHRLDADTSGIVLVATEATALRHLQDCFAAGRIEKTYLALVRGLLKEQGQRSTYLVLHEQGAGFERWGTGRGAGAMRAITAWQRQELVGRHASLVQVRPKTGRTHQIRVHMAELGHPLIGDRVYGDRSDPIIARRHMLHATGLRLPLPDGSQATIAAPLPKDFRQAMQQLKQI